MSFRGITSTTCAYRFGSVGPADLVPDDHEEEEEEEDEAPARPEPCDTTASRMAADKASSTHLGELLVSNMVAEGEHR